MRDVILRLGASAPMMTMDNDMVCETTADTLEVTRDRQNAAIMHVIDLLPA